MISHLHDNFSLKAFIHSFICSTNIPRHTLSHAVIKLDAAPALVDQKLERQRDSKLVSLCYSRMTPQCKLC